MTGCAHGIAYTPEDRAKSELYHELPPRLNSYRVVLLDHSRLIAQLTGPERHTARGGRDVIDHAPGRMTTWPTRSGPNRQLAKQDLTSPKVA